MKENKKLTKRERENKKIATIVTIIATAMIILGISLTLFLYFGTWLPGINASSTNWWIRKALYGIALFLALDGFTYLLKLSEKLGSEEYDDEVE